MNFPGQFIAVYPLIQYLWKTAGATPKPPFSLWPESSRPLATPFGTGEYPLDMAIFCSVMEKWGILWPCLIFRQLSHAKF